MAKRSPVGPSSGVDFLQGSAPLGDRLFSVGARIINTGEFIMPASEFNQKLVQEPGRRHPVLQPYPINQDGDALRLINDTRMRNAAHYSGGHHIERSDRFKV